MFIIIQGQDPSNADLLSKMYDLRQKLFVKGKKWVAADKERDKFDDQCSPVYLLSVGEEKKVRGVIRLLPTTGPTLHEEIFRDHPEMEKVDLQHPEIWESSRAGIDNALRGPERREALKDIVNGLRAFTEQYDISSVIGDVDHGMLRLYRGMHLKPDVLAENVYKKKILYTINSPRDGIIASSKLLEKRAQ